MTFYNHFEEGGVGPLQYIENSGKPEPRLEMIQKYPELREVIEQCLQIDQRKRPSAQELYKSPFFNEYTTKLDKCHTQFKKNYISELKDVDMIQLRQIKPEEGPI